MLGLTGILGSAACQPGSFQLGAGPASSGILIEATVTATQDISFSIEHRLWQVLPEAITVTPAIGLHLDRNLIVTSTVTISTTIMPNREAFTYLTGQFVEVLYASITYTRLSGEFIEILYKRETAATVTSTVTVSQTVSGHNSNNWQTITNSIGVVSSVNIQHTENLQTITHSLTPAPLINLAGNRNIVLTQSANVAPLIQFRNTVIRITLAQSLSTGQGEAPSILPSVITVGNTINIGTSMHTSPHYLSFSHSVNVVPFVSGGSSFRAITNTVQVGLAQTIVVATNYANVASTITVSQSIDTHNDRVQIPITDLIIVNPQIIGGNSRREIVIKQLVHISPVVFRKDRLPDIFTDTINISTLVRCNNQIWPITVNGYVTVTDRFTQFSNMQVSDSITVNSHIAAPVPISVHNYVGVFQTITNRGPRVEIILTDTLTVTPSISLIGRQVISKTIRSFIQIVESIRLKDYSVKYTESLTVDPIATSEIRHSVYAETITSTIQVLTWNKINFNSQNVISTLNVTQKIKQLDWTIKQNINVRARPHAIQTMHFVENVSIDGTLTKTRTRPFRPIENLPVTEVLNRQLIIARHFKDIIPIGRDYYPIEDPLFNGYVVSALQVTLVSNIPSVYMSCPLAGQIILPPPEFGDSGANADTTKVLQTMTGGSYAFIKSSNRQTFKWAFIVGQLKALELRSWLIKALSETVEITDIYGIKWIGKIMSNPFTLDFQGRWEGEVERVMIDLEFQVVRA